MTALEGREGRDISDASTNLEMFVFYSSSLDPLTSHLAVTDQHVRLNLGNNIVKEAGGKDEIRTYQDIFEPLCMMIFLVLTLLTAFASCLRDGL